MSLADTAKLIVELALRDRLSPGLRNVDRSLSGLDRTMAGVNTRVSRTGIAIGTAFGIGLERAVVGGVSAFVGGVRTGIEEMQRLEDANLQTLAALRSTDGQSGQTAKGIRAMAEEYENLNATVDDKAIQEAANKLLTFTAIQGDVFKDALEASLDLSTRMGGDVQGAIIQVGKALQDPVRGVTALRRAGVQLNQQQEAQIKTLVEQNRLYDAQQIILGELNTQVGGSFAAQGQGDAARAAALRDRIEDLQRVLATGLAPGLTRVREGLIGAFDNPQVIAGVRAVGENIANFLSAENLRTAGGLVKDVFGFLGSVPWGAIGGGLRIVGAGAKVAIDAFNALPREVQGIVIAGLAANKLSGGIAGSLAVRGIEALLNGLKTINAAHVTVVGGTVTGGPGGIPGKTGGFGGSVVQGLKTGGALASIPLAGIAAVEVINFGDMRDKAIGGLEGKLDNLGRNNLAATERSIAAIKGQIDQERPWLEGILFNTNVKPVLERELVQLQGIQSAQRETTRTTDSRLLALSGNYAGTNARLDRSNASLATIAAKNFNPTINLTNSIRLSPTVIQQRIVQQNVISGFTSNDNSAGI